MALLDGDISGVRNKIVRGQLLAKMKREKAQTKLKKRIARKEAENRGEVVERGELQFLFSQEKHRIGLAWLVCVLQDLHLAPEMRVVYFELLMLTFFLVILSLSGWTRTIDNTKQWLGESAEYSDPRTRPAKVEVDEATGDVRVDLGTLATLFPPQAPLAEGEPIPLEPKILITTSPGKPSSLATIAYCEDLVALLGGKNRADIVPRRSPKFELGKVARWARGRGYGAIAVVGEDHSKPSKLSPRDTTSNLSTNYSNPDLQLL